MIRSRKLLDAAQGKPCVACSRAITEKTVPAHYQGMRSAQYGKGKGIKVHDILCADLCDECHARADSSALARDFSHLFSHLRDSETRQLLEDVQKIEHSEEFLHYVALTIIRRMEEGVLVVV